jgi:hypothetical protein
MQEIIHAQVNNRKWHLDCILMYAINNNDNGEGHDIVIAEKAYWCWDDV